MNRWLKCMELLSTVWKRKMALVFFTIEMLTWICLFYSLALSGPPGCEQPIAAPSPPERSRRMEGLLCPYVLSYCQSATIEPLCCFLLFQRQKTEQGKGNGKECTPPCCSTCHMLGQCLAEARSSELSQGLPST